MHVDRTVSSKPFFESNLVSLTLSIAGRMNSNRCSYLDLHHLDRCRSSKKTTTKRNYQQLFLHSRSHSIISIQDGDVAQQLMFHSIFLHDSSTIRSFCFSRFIHFFFFKRHPIQWLMHIFLNISSLAIQVRYPYRILLTFVYLIRCWQIMFIIAIHR